MKYVILPYDELKLQEGVVERGGAALTLADESNEYPYVRSMDDYKGSIIYEKEFGSRVKRFGNFIFEEWMTLRIPSGTHAYRLKTSKELKKIKGVNRNKKRSHIFDKEGEKIIYNIEMDKIPLKHFVVDPKLLKEGYHVHDPLVTHNRWVYVPWFTECLSCDRGDDFVVSAISAMRKRGVYRKFILEYKRKHEKLRPLKTFKEKELMVEMKDLLDPAVFKNVMKSI
jgi:hypothetical protein